MGKLKIVLGIVLVLVVAVVGIGIISNPSEDTPDTPNDQETEPPTNPDPEPEELEPEPTITRYDKIPEDATKMTPESDNNPTVLHSYLWEDPVILEGGINTAGAEDSPFISPDGSKFYFFFTPDASIPAEQQLTDGLTGIWVSEWVDDGWAEGTRVKLSNNGLSLDGCAYVSPEEIWFCSARLGNFKGIDFWIGTLSEDGVVDIRNAGKELNKEVVVGELHITPDGNTIYYHSDVAEGFGGMDVWAVEREGDGWGEPYNIEAVNSPDHEGYPYISPDGSEMWINKWYMGSPGTFRSKLVEGEWTTPELILSSFAGEPNLDAEGNIYFVHHYIEDGKIIEADIFVAYKKPVVTPIDTIDEPSRGYLMGVLPIPYDGQDFAEAYEMASENCELIPVWGKPSPYWEKVADLEGFWGETFIDDLTRGNDMAPLLHFSFIGEGLTLASPPGTGYSLSNQEWRLQYKRAVIESVEAAKPAYLSVGNEVNRWYEKYGYDGDNGFRHWVSLYEEIYDEVKALSPETKVFCTFSREMVSENREADMSVLDYFDPDKLDVLVFTSYPHSLPGVNRPSDIPEDYYSGVADLMQGKPVGFSEITWPSMTEFGGEQAQVDFITRLDGDLTSGFDMEFIMWPWLSDLTDTDTVGLIQRDGTPKQGYTAWIELAGN